MLWRETRDVEPTHLQISRWLFINRPHFRYQSSYVVLGICFHLVNTNRRIFKPPFDPDISHAGHTAGRAAFVSPTTLCCKWKTLHAEPVGLCEAGNIPTSGSTTASQLPSLIDELFLTAEILTACVIQARWSCWSSAALACEVWRVSQANLHGWRIWESSF